MCETMASFVLFSNHVTIPSLEPLKPNQPMGEGEPFKKCGSFGSTLAGVIQVELKVER